MKLAIFLSHLGGTFTGLSLAVVRRDWLYLQAFVIGQLLVALGFVVWPERFGRKPPPEQAAEYVFRERQVQADLEARWGPRR